MIAFVVDPKPASQWLAGLFREQIPFATSLALNQTAKDVQAAERAHLTDAFTIRRPWVTQGVTIPKFSDKHDAVMSVTVQVDPTRSFLGKFEAGGAKYGSPDEPIAIPSVNVRPALVDLPPLSLYPKNLRLQPRHGVTGILAAQRHVTKRGVVQLQGKQRTFVLDAATMFGVRVSGVYQRTGPGKHDIRLLWTYKPRIPIPARLAFVPTAERTIIESWGPRFEAAFRRAVATAK